VLRWVEEEGNFGGFFRRIVIGGTWNILLLQRWYISWSHVLRNISALSDSGLWEPVGNDKRLRLVFAGARHDLEGLHGADWVSESVIVVLNIDSTTWHIIHARLKFSILRLLHYIKQSVHLVSCHLWLFVFVGFGLSVGVVEVDGDDLLRDWVLESTCAFICLPPGQVETITNIVVARCWLLRFLLEYFLWQQGALLLRYEGARAAVIVAFDWFGAVLADTRVGLLEVNVHSDRLDIVERILLIEWQTEVTLVFHLRPGNVFFDGVWCILAWTNIDSWISSQHVRLLNETLLLRCKVLIEYLAVQTHHLGHL